MNWIPLESNPEVLNRYIKSLGIKTQLQFQDVWGLDPDTLSMVPPPLKAMILLFPITKSNESHRQQLVEQSRDRPISSQVYFMTQTIGNACGTMYTSANPAVSSTPSPTLYPTKNLPAPVHSQKCTMIQKRDGPKSVRM